MAPVNASATISSSLSLSTLHSLHVNLGNCSEPRCFRYAQCKHTADVSSLGPLSVHSGLRDLCRWDQINSVFTHNVASKCVLQALQAGRVNLVLTAVRPAFKLFVHLPPSSTNRHPRRYEGPKFWFVETSAKRPHIQATPVVYKYVKHVEKDIIDCTVLPQYLLHVKDHHPSKSLLSRHLNGIWKIRPLVNSAS